MPLGKLSRADMEALLVTCHREQRPPTHDELHPPSSKRLRAEHAHLLALPDALIAKVRDYLPLKDRVLFGKATCKQVASIASEHNMFSTLIIGYARMDDTDDLNRLSTPPPNWGFLGDSQVETLVLRGTRGAFGQPALPPSHHLQHVKALTLEGSTVPTIKAVHRSIQPANLTELNLKSSQDVGVGGSAAR